MTATAAIVVLALASGLAQAPPGGGCSASPVLPGGPFVESRFFAASPQRTHEALEDAMQAAGVLLFERTGALVRGERTAERVGVLKLPKGDEAVFGYLEAAEKDGTAGMLVRVETRRRAGNEGVPKQSWSGAILNEAECLLTTLVAAPDRLPPASGPTPERSGVQGREVLVPAETAVPLVLRRFLFSSDLRVNEKVLFEVASDVTVGPDIVIRRGTLAVARVKDIQELSGSKPANATLELDPVSATDGAPVRLRSPMRIAGRAGKFLKVSWEFAYLFVVCAGTRFDLAVSGDHVVGVRRE